MSLELRLDAEELRPLVAEVVREVLAALRADEAKLGDRLAWNEAEAAELLGLHAHQLRDVRLRGEIAASRIVGGRVVYSRDDLLAYLGGRRVAADGRGDGWRCPGRARRGRAG